MKRIELKSLKRQRRKKGLRKRIFGVPDKPRLSVFRSAKHIYAQIIDDLTGSTLVSASTNEKGAKSDKGGNCKVKAKANSKGDNRKGNSRESKSCNRIAVAAGIERLPRRGRLQS